MNQNMQYYKKCKDYLVCVDSDGTVMDTMEEKHRNCFGPELVRAWAFFEDEEEILNEWYRINLYAPSRGINRFKGLAVLLEWIRKNKNIEVKGMDDYIDWVNHSGELSNDSLLREVKRRNSECLKKALQWSKDVNYKITLLPKSSKPFKNVEMGLKVIEKYADIVVVSSANSQALEEEWKRNCLDGYVKMVLGQEAGTKKECIKHLLEKGYDKNNVLMLGDAIGDMEAAQANNVGFYPVLAGKEAESWKKLAEDDFLLLIHRKFDKAFQKKIIMKFIDSFQKKL